MNNATLFCLFKDEDGLRVVMQIATRSVGKPTELVLKVP